MISEKHQKLLLETPYMSKRQTAAMWDYIGELRDRIATLEAALGMLRGHLLDYIPPNRQWKGPADTAVEYIDDVLGCSSAETKGERRNMPPWPTMGTTQTVFVDAGRLEPCTQTNDEETIVGPNYKYQEPSNLPAQTLNTSKTGAKHADKT